MGFSKDWDSRYKEGTHLSVWPWSDLVSFVMRYSRPTGAGMRVLEIGCGAGANIPFFKSIGADYYSVEGSSEIVSSLIERFPELNGRIVTGDFTEQLNVPGEFDLVFDRGSITCNTQSSIERCLKLVNAKLKPEGKFIGIDWYSSDFSDKSCGEIIDDPYTRGNFTSGRLKGTGKVHFSDEAHIRKLLADFNLTVLEHKVVSRKEPQDGWQFASWNFVAERLR